MNTQRLFATLLLLSTGLMVGTFAWAVDSNELKNVQAQISSQQQNQQQHSKQLKQLKQQLAKDEKAISAMARTLNKTQHQLKTNESELVALDKEYDMLNQQAEQQKILLAQQLRAAYQNGRHDYLKLLLNGQDGTEIDRMLHYYAHLNQVRSDALHQLARTREQLTENRHQAELGRHRLNELLAQQQSEQKKLRAQQNARSQTAKQLNITLDKGNQRLANLQQAAAHLEQQIKAAQEKAAREQAARELAEREAQARANSGSGRTPVVAKLSGHFSGLTKGAQLWPLKGKLIHRFGGARTSQLKWKGLLISAPEGEKVQAIANGQVVYADWLNGFGMVMVIDHGKGYLSIYGHNQSLLRNPGDTVKAGQSIALSGESGGQEKPGLYFEIRYQGSAIDPLPWLKS